MATLKVVGASWMRTKISSYVLGLLGVLAILALILGQIERTPESGNYAATVYYSEKGYNIQFHGQSNNLEEVDRGVARAVFRSDVDTAGWSVLEVETDGSYHDEVQAYAAGVVEGALTWYHINSHLANTKCENKYSEKQCDKLKDALDMSVNIWKNHADDRGRNDPFWHQVSLYFTQIGGVETGWKYGMERSLDELEVDSSDINWLNFVSEMGEIQHKLNISLEDPALGHLPGMSSALLRIVNETSEDTVTKKLFVAQNAAGSYAGMTKILKRYKFHYHQTSQEHIPTPVTQVDFSSYPGTVTSQDDFYVLSGNSQRMAVTGTTLKNYNPKLWKEVNITEQLPLGPRVSAANRLATGVSAWAHVLATNNSGTGCKQWLVVDFNRLNTSDDVTLDTSDGKKEVVMEINVNNGVRHTVVHPAHPSRASGLVWLIEQVPGLTHARDVSTSLLEQGYYATYGLPIIDDIAKITHIHKMQSLYGAIFSLSESPRAVTFRNGSTKATSLESVIKLMRQNNITALRDNDGSECSDEVECIIKEGGYWSVLGVRGDIVNKHKTAYGITDTKVVIGTVNQSSLDFIAVAGPPYTDVPSSNSTKTPVNKGNVATIYTDQFNNQTDFDGLEIRDLVKQQMEDAAEEAQAELDKHIIKPFQWSQSEFDESPHMGLPDTWAFKQYKPNWFW